MESSGKGEDGGADAHDLLEGGALALCAVRGRHPTGHHQPVLQLPLSDRTKRADTPYHVPVDGRELRGDALEGDGGVGVEDDAGVVAAVVGAQAVHAGRHQSLPVPVHLTKGQVGDGRAARSQRKTS